MAISMKLKKVLYHFLVLCSILSVRKIGLHPPCTDYTLLLQQERVPIVFSIPLLCFLPSDGPCHHRHIHLYIYACHHHMTGELWNRGWPLWSFHFTNSRWSRLYKRMVPLSAFRGRSFLVVLGYPNLLVRKGPQTAVCSLHSEVKRTGLVYKLSMKIL